MENPYFNYSKAMVQVTRDWFLSRKALEKLVYRKLLSVLFSAYNHVPYYQMAMKMAGYNPEKHYSGVNDLQYFPIVTKEAYKNNETDFLMQGIDLEKCYCSHTSGSTGIPLRIYRTPYERAVQIAKWMRVLFINDYLPFYKVMSLSSPQISGSQPSLIQRMGFFRRKIVDFLSSPEEITDFLLEYKPQVLYGNRQQLDFVALELQRRNIRLSNLKLLIETGAIIRNNHKHFHQHQFGTPLVESFGSEEMGTMAHETRNSEGQIICEDTTIIEFLDDNNKPVGPDEPGRVVVTDLTNRLNPFIRYDHGDYAIYRYNILSDGSKQKVIKKILGRECDYVILPDGTHRLYYDFYDIISRFNGIRQCRIVQKSSYLVHMEIAAEKEYLSQITPDLLRRVVAAFPDEIEFIIVHKDAISPDPSGKIRMFITEVQSLPDLTPNMHRPMRRRGNN